MDININHRSPPQVQSPPFSKTCCVCYIIILYSAVFRVVGRNQGGWLLCQWFRSGNEFHPTEFFAPQSPSDANSHQETATFSSSHSTWAVLHLSLHLCQTITHKHFTPTAGGMLRDDLLKHQMCRIEEIVHHNKILSYLSHPCEALNSVFEL